MRATVGQATAPAYEQTGDSGEIPEQASGASFQWWVKRDWGLGEKAGLAGHSRPSSAAVDQLDTSRL